MLLIPISSRMFLGVGLAVLIAACGGPAAKPTVMLSTSATTLDDGQELTLSATVTGNAAKVEFFKGTDKVGEDTSAPYELKLAVTSNDDATFSFTAKATATDSQFAVSEAVNVSVKVDKTPPTFTDFKASSNSLNAAGTVILTATATDNKGVVKVEFYKGLDKLGESTTPVGDTFSLSVPVSAADNGSLTYTAKAFDKKGNVGTSAEVMVTVAIKGSLSVSISGLPNGTPASVKVTGPENFSQDLTATTTLGDLKAGDYTLTPNGVDSGDYSYAAASSTVAVSNGNTANGSVSYAANTGALTVSVSGLPAGQNVTVTFPDNTSQNIATTKTFKKLVAGSYTISAADMAGYNKTISGSPATVSIGNTASAGVGYVPVPGSLDTNFGTGGKLTTDFGLSTDEAMSVAIYPNDGSPNANKIVVAGSSSIYPNKDFALVRLHSNGLPDTSFDTDGMVTTHLGSDYEAATSVAIQSDGKIVVAGYSQNGGNDYAFTLVRYNSDGKLDTSFDTDGIVKTDFGSEDDVANSVAIQSDGKIVVAGCTNCLYGTKDFALVRYNPDGSLDNSFDTDGKVTTDFGSSSDEAYSVALQSDGKIVVAGESRIGSNDDFALVRLHSNGSLDNSFDTDGKVTTDFGSADDVANSVALQSDGKIVVAGSTGDSQDLNRFALVRLHSDGSLDTSFGTVGKVTTDFGSSEDDNRANSVALALQSDGKIVAAGYSHNGSNDDFALVRLHSNGSLDTSFDTDGKVTTAIGSGNDYANSVAIQSDGKIVVAGFSSSSFALARYNP